MYIFPFGFEAPPDSGSLLRVGLPARAIWAPLGRPLLDLCRGAGVQLVLGSSSGIIPCVVCLSRPGRRRVQELSTLLS